MSDKPPLPSGLVTFMFTDIVGSTDMKGLMPGVTTAERQDAFLQQVKAPHEAIIKELVGKHGGCVVEGTGDGFFIAFGDAEQAVLCGVVIQQRISAAKIFTPSGILQIRIGLSSGQATPVANGYTASAADKAARVQAKATPGQVYLSHETNALVSGKVRGIVTASAGFEALKGFAVEELYIASYEAPLPLPPLVGRKRVTGAKVTASTISASNGRRRVQYFISYTRADDPLPAKLLTELRKQFSACKDYELVSWQDTDILPGEDWPKLIEAAISTCDFGLLLVSPAFLGNDFITKRELPYYVGGRKPCIPVGIHKIDMDSQDLKGLQDVQIYRYETDRSKSARGFADCSKKVQIDFAHALYKRIVARLNKHFAASAMPKP